MLSTALLQSTTIFSTMLTLQAARLNQSSWYVLVHLIFLVKYQFFTFCRGIPPPRQLKATWCLLSRNTTPCHRCPHRRFRLLADPGSFGTEKESPSTLEFRCIILIILTANIGLSSRILKNSFRKHSFNATNKAFEFIVHYSSIEIAFVVAERRSNGWLIIYGIPKENTLLVKAEISSKAKVQKG